MSVVKRADYYFQEPGDINTKQVIEIIENSYIDFEKMIRDVLYVLGQGFKVAVEVTLISVDKGLVDEGEEVIAIGGTDKRG